jgi:prolipoprotein diacylglyceryltransferase
MGLTLFLLWMMRKRHRVGVLVTTFVIWYAAVRLITDFLRVENRFVGLTGSQWASVGSIALCLVVLAWIRRRGDAVPAPVGVEARETEPPEEAG